MGLYLGVAFERKELCTCHHGGLCSGGMASHIYLLEIVIKLMSLQLRSHLDFQVIALLFVRGLPRIKEQ